MNTFEILKGHYENHDEDARLLSRHGQVEFLTTVRYVENYLAPGMRIAEIGAGTGRYSHYYARAGYEVDAVELVPHNIEIFKQNTLDGEKITVTQGNACDLNFMQSNTYDITLLLGPMYHLYTEQDKLAALSEAIRITKSGGVVFAAYCNNDATMIGFCFVHGNIIAAWNNNMIDPVTFKCISEPKEVFELYRKEDVDSLMSHFNTTRLHYVGTDMATNFIRETVDAMEMKCLRFI